MKRTAVILLILFVGSQIRAQNFTSFPGKNKNQNLTAINHSYVGVTQTGRVGGHINTIPETKRIKVFFDNASRKNKETKNQSISKLYVKLYGGYGIFTPGSFRVNAVYFLHDTAVKTQGKRGLGSGQRFGGGIGLVMNDFLNIGIDAEYHKGAWKENSLNARIDDLNYDIRNSEINYKTISLTPYVIFKALAKPNYFIYNKLGILFTLPFTLSTSLQSTHANNQNLGNDANKFIENLNSTISEQYKISLGVGLNVALGLNLKVNEKLRAFAEVFGNYSALSPISSVKIDYSKRFASLSFNSENSEPIIVKQISAITTNTTYEKGGSLPVNGTYRSRTFVLADDYTETDVTINTLAHKFTINMAALGVNLGIIYRF